MHRLAGKWGMATFPKKFQLLLKSGACWKMARLSQSAEERLRQSVFVMHLRLDVVSNIKYSSANYVHGMVECDEARFLIAFRTRKGSAVNTGDASRKWAFCVSGVERRYRQFSAATLHADMLDKPALNGRGFARCSNRLLQRNRFLPIDPAPSRRNLHLISARMFHTAHAVSDSPMAGHRYVRSIV